METPLSMSMFANEKDYEAAMSKRDLSPHRPAKVAMFLWPASYAQSGLGSMRFWDSLTEREQQLCRVCVAEILASRNEA